MHSLSVDYMWFLLGTEEKPVKSFFTSPKNNTEINGFAEHLTQVQTDSTWESSAYIFFSLVLIKERNAFSRWEQAAITKLRGHEFRLGVVEVGEMSKV